MSGRFVAAVRDRVAAIAFDDGGMNLLSADALAELDAVLDGLPAGLELLCFYSGHASVFAAGADMQEMERFTALEALRFAGLGQSLFTRIERLPCLTVAAIDGDCFGGALDLSLAFDLRIATPRSRFSHPGSRIGIVTGFGGTSRWRRQTDAPSARALFLANRIFSAGEARNHDLVDAVVDGLRGRETELSLEFLTRRPGEVRFVKELGRIPPELPAEQHSSFASALAAVYLTPTQH